MAKYNKQTATIASSGTTSNYIDLQGNTVCAFRMPSSFIGTAITFLESDLPTGTYQTYYKDGADYSVQVAASKTVAVTPADFAGVSYLKIVSNATEAASCDIIVVSRDVL